MRLEGRKKERDGLVVLDSQKPREILRTRRRELLRKQMTGRTRRQPMGKGRFLALDHQK